MKIHLVKRVHVGPITLEGPKTHKGLKLMFCFDLPHDH